MPSLFNPRSWTLSIRKHGTSKPDADTQTLFVQATRLRIASPLGEKTSTDFAADLVTDLLKAFPDGLSNPVIDALLTVFENFSDDECLSPAPHGALSKPANHSGHKALRAYLKRQIAFFSDYEIQMEQLRMYLLDVSSALLGSVPTHAISPEQEPSLFGTPFHTVMSDLPKTLETVITSSFYKPFQDLGLLATMQERLEANVMAVSKIDPSNPPSNIHKYTLPSQARDMRATEMVDRYFTGTPFQALLNMELPLVISDQSRMEHGYILAGSGHGKTQLMQNFIMLDLAAAKKEKRSIVVIDSQGDLISKIARIELFNPAYKGTPEDLHGILSDRIVIIDPNDVDYPSAINMFAMNETRMASYGSTEREKVQNSAIELYEHFFSELLGAELTARQGMVFKYLARLMLEIPDATILTLRDLMDDAKPFIPYMDKLSASARVFFAREFFSPGFNATKKQISKRLWGVLSTPAFERLFSSPTNKIDLYQLLNDGHIILINTAKDLLKESGASLFGRFFISMLTQAIMERSVISEDERTPTFIYIDECQDYFDANIELLLAQGRKYKTGLCLAHQFLDQLTVSERGSVLANTSIKLAGGVNAKDAKILATEMGCRSDFLQSMKKADDTSETEFALWVRNSIREAVKVSVPIGKLEELPTMTDLDFAAVRERNRDLYGWEYAQSDNSLEVSFPGYERPQAEEAAVHEGRTVAAEPDEAPIVTEASIEAKASYVTDPDNQPGRGGASHTETQTLLRSLAHHFGWRAETEHPVDAGYVDVWLSREGRSIACEVTVTTDVRYEIGNIEKCLEAGADEVWLISENADKLETIKDRMGYKPKIWFFTPDALEVELGARTPTDGSETSTIRGYEVEVVPAFLSDQERDIRRERLNHLVANLKMSQ